MAHHNCLVFYSSTNKAGRRDATGAFIPEARAFQRLHGVPDHHMVPIPQSIPRAQRYAAVVHHCAVHAGADLDAVVYFGHGTASTLPGLGASNARALAGVLAPACAPHVRVVLYACSAGKGLGVADRLALALWEHCPYALVIAHLVPGHTTRNPRCEYSGAGPDGAGEPIVAPGSDLYDEWVALLRSDQRFRLSFPFMARGEIEARLRGDSGPLGPTTILPERP